MGKIYVLHNKNAKESRDLVSTLSAGEIVIDWYSENSEKKDYLSKGMPHPSTFPSVVDDDYPLISRGHTTIEEFKQDLADQIVVFKEIKKKKDFIKSGLNQMDKGREILAFIGATIDASTEEINIGLLNTRFFDVIILLLTGSCATAKLAITDVNISGTGLTEENRTAILNEF